MRFEDAAVDGRNAQITTIQSPMPNLCAQSSPRPPRRLLKNSCRAKPSTMEPTPIAASRLRRSTAQMLDTIAAPQTSERPILSPLRTDS